MNNPFKKKADNQPVVDIPDETIEYNVNKPLTEPEVEEDEEYEYVTPHYTGNAILLLVCCMIASTVISFLVFNTKFEKETEKYYIEQGYMLTNDGANATSADIAYGKTAYVRGKLVIGTYQAIDATLATATADDILEGHTAYTSTGKVTGTIPVYDGLLTIAPASYTQYVWGGQYIANSISISGTSTLLPENIKAGVNIFGVTGTYTGDDSEETTGGSGE